MERMNRGRLRQPSGMPGAEFVHGVASHSTAELADPVEPIQRTGTDETEAHADALAELRPRPPVSVVVVSFNCNGPLIDCLRSLEVERGDVPLEVVLVDNDSRDDTAYAVATGFPWVRLIVNRQNLGFSRAVNEGLRFTNGDYVLILNPDTVVPPGTIGRVVYELERHPDVGMLGCKLVRPDGTFDHACKRGFPTLLSALYYFSGLARRFPRSPYFAQYTAAHLGIDEAGPVDAVNGAFMLVRRSAVDEVGQLDERFWLWAEDLDWCQRYWERGWKVLYWPEAEVVHLKSASVGDRRSLRLNFAFHRSIWLYYAKHQAPHRSPVISALVWLGVWSKFAASTVANGVRSVSRPAPAEDARSNSAAA
jgi:GT2 family glycosyltransferase